MLIKKFAVCVILLFLQTFQVTGQEKPLISYADPFVAVHGNGNTHPAATLPYSLVSLGPDAAYPQSTSGYSQNAGERFLGFSHVRLSGTGGGSRYGNFLVIPQAGAIQIPYQSFSIASEEASPGYYSCELPTLPVSVQLTLTDRVGIHRYQFESGAERHILIDVAATRLTRDKSRCLEARVEIVNDSCLQGFARYEAGWGGLNPYTAYFYASFDQSATATSTFRRDSLFDQKQIGARGVKELMLGAAFTFSPNSASSSVQLKLGVSYTSIEKAKQEVERASGWNHNAFRMEAASKWESFLNRLEIYGGSEEQRYLFYSAFYKTAMLPRDLTGDNPLWKSNEPHFWDFYTFWDTHRTLNPLLTLIDPEKEVEIIRCLLDIYRHKGWLPDSFTAGDYGVVQGGSSADVVVAEAIVKGLKGFDYDLAWEALEKDAKVQSGNPFKAGRYADQYNRLGYLPTPSASGRIDPPCGTSRSIEYSYNDYCIALAAKKLGREKDYEHYLDRSSTIFTTLFNDSLKLFWAKDSIGQWIPGYSTKSNSYSSNGVWQGWYGPFYEGSPLSYSCAALQDIARIIQSHGGAHSFMQFLDRVFDSGQFESDNEPALALPWMYIYAGDTHKTYERVHSILTKHFRHARDGWPGSDDAGTIAAWYLWASMGIYPVAGQDIYLLTTPSFPVIKINLPGKRSFSIISENLSASNTYIQQATLNGKPLQQAWLRHSDMAAGGKLVLVMGDKDKSWGANYPPPSFDAVANW